MVSWAPMRGSGGWWFAGGTGDALSDAGELPLAYERAERREVFAGGGAGGEEELLRHVEEGRRAGTLVVRAHFGEEAAVEEGADQGVGVDAAYLGDRAERQGTVVEGAGEDLVGGTGERRWARLLAEALDRRGAGRVRKEKVAARDVPQNDAGVLGRVAPRQGGEGGAYLLLEETGGGAEGLGADRARAREEDGLDQVRGLRADRAHAPGSRVRGPKGSGWESLKRPSWASESAAAKATALFRRSISLTSSS